MHRLQAMARMVQVAGGPIKLPDELRVNKSLPHDQGVDENWDPLALDHQDENKSNNHASNIFACTVATNVRLTLERARGECVCVCVCVCVWVDWLCRWADYVMNGQPSATCDSHVSPLNALTPHTPSACSAQGGRGRGGRAQGQARQEVIGTAGRLWASHEPYLSRRRGQQKRQGGADDGTWDAELHHLRKTQTDTCTIGAQTYTQTYFSRTHFVWYAT
jgi:hypothetical protein